MENPKEPGSARRGSPTVVTCSQLPTHLPLLTVSNAGTSTIFRPSENSRCSSVCVIPLQIIIPCPFTLHLTFQSALITHIISSSNCLQDRSQLSKQRPSYQSQLQSGCNSAPNNSLPSPLALSSLKSLHVCHSTAPSKQPSASSQAERHTVQMRTWGSGKEHHPRPSQQAQGVYLPRSAHSHTPLIVEMKLHDDMRVHYKQFLHFISVNPLNLYSTVLKIHCFIKDTAQV